jgi:hypothetical protein
MIKESIRRILKRIRSDKILNKIGSGKSVYFENPLEEIALRYIPGEPGKVGKYFAKHYGRNEYEIDFNSSSVLMGVMEGKPISKTRYKKYHLIEGVYWNRNANFSCTRHDYNYQAQGHQVSPEPV